MNDLVRRAMLGDRQAQAECTRQGITLPCPKCHSGNLTIEDDSKTVYDPQTLGYLYSTEASVVYVFCEDCGMCSEVETVGPGEDYEDAEKRLIESWNTRPAPPVGRCADCDNWDKYIHAGRESFGTYVCVCHEWSDEENGHMRYTSPVGFCNNFEPREE